MKDQAKEIIEMLSGAAGNLAQFVANSSYELWQRKDFRLYVDFDNITQTEQDRIFNELEVSVLGIFALHLDYAASILPKEQKIVIESLERELVPSFLKLFSDLGIEEKFVKQWKTLIDMRFKEYREDFKIALKESESMEEFKNEDENLRTTWARIETITIDCLTHIRRGKVEKDDPLWKLLRKWFITVDASLNPITALVKEEKKLN